METKVKALNEKNDLIKHLELIETDIKTRERASHKEDFDKAMFEKIEQLTSERNKNAELITTLNYNLEYAIYNYHQMRIQNETILNENSKSKNQLDEKTIESTEKTNEIETLKLKVLQVNTLKKILTLKILI